MPSLTGVLETCLYYDEGEREAMEALYRDLLELAVVSEWGDGTALRVGAGVLLLFDRSKLAKRDEPMAAHGASGPGHACLVASSGDYDAWRELLAKSGV